jgi:hypothetical protein
MRTRGQQQQTDLAAFKGTVANARDKYQVAYRGMWVTVVIDVKNRVGMLHCMMDIGPSLSATCAGVFQGHARKPWGSRLSLNPTVNAQLLATSAGC